MEKKPSQEPRPVLTGEEANPISLKEAAAWTAHYRERFPDEVISYFFGINIINEIIKQEGCVGLRVYYANSKPLNGFQKFIVAISNFLRRTIANADGEKHLIVVGSDSHGNDSFLKMAPKACQIRKPSMKEKLKNLFYMLGGVRLNIMSLRSRRCHARVLVALKISSQVLNGF